MDQFFISISLIIQHSAMVVPPEIVARVKDGFFVHKLPKTVIARENQISVRTVYSIIDDVNSGRVRERKQYDSTARQILSEQHLIEVERYLSEVNINATLDELLRECYLPAVTKSALSQFLKKNNVRTLVARKKKKLDRTEMQERIDFSNRLKDFDQSHLDRLVSTDEASIVTGLGRCYIRIRDDRTRNHESLFQRNQQLRKFKINIYGFITTSRFEIYRIPPKFNREHFHDLMVNQNLLDIIEESVDGQVIFLQDNSTVHEFPESAEETFRRHLENRGIEYQYLPAYSPDFNTLENVWNLLKSGVRKELRHRTVKTNSGN